MRPASPKFIPLPFSLARQRWLRRPRAPRQARHSLLVRAGRRLRAQPSRADAAARVEPPPARIRLSNPHTRRRALYSAVADRGRRPLVRAGIPGDKRRGKRAWGKSRPIHSISTETARLASPPPASYVAAPRKKPRGRVSRTGGPFARRTFFGHFRVSTRTVSPF